MFLWAGKNACFTETMIVQWQHNSPATILQVVSSVLITQQCFTYLDWIVCDALLQICIIATKE